MLRGLLGVADCQQDVRKSEMAQRLRPLIAGLLVQAQRAPGVVGGELVVPRRVVEPRQRIVDAGGNVAVELVAAVAKHAGQQLRSLGVAARVGLRPC